MSDNLTRDQALTIAAGLPPIRLHDLRYGTASLMLAAGVDMKVVQETRGHANIGLTANTYTSVCEPGSSASPAVSAEIPSGVSALRLRSFMPVPRSLLT